MRIVMTARLAIGSRWNCVAAVLQIYDVGRDWSVEVGDVE